MQIAKALKKRKQFTDIISCPLRTSHLQPLPPPPLSPRGKVGNSGANAWAINFRLFPQCGGSARVIILHQNSGWECWLHLKSILKNIPCILMEFGHRGRGIKSRAITISLSPHYVGYNRALRNEKLLSPLFPCTWGAVVTNDMTNYFQMGASFIHQNKTEYCIQMQLAVQGKTFLTGHLIGWNPQTLYFLIYFLHQRTSGSEMLTWDLGLS